MMRYMLKCRTCSLKTVLCGVLAACIVYYCFYPDIEDINPDDQAVIDSLWLGKCYNIRRSKKLKDKKCDVLGYIDKLDKYRVTSKYPLPSYLLYGCKHVFYNRIPKCGSQSLYEAFTTLGGRYNYVVKKKAKGMGRDPSKRPHKVEPYLQSVQEIDQPQVTTKHIYFIDFVRNKLLEQPMVMINVVRDPVEQVISIYSWRRWGDSVREAERDPSQFVDLDTCLKKFKSGAECLSWEMTMLPFLCEGDHHNVNCWERAAPSEISIQRAKWHVSHTFLTVGLTEDLPAFSEVLETMLPHLFCNLTQVYRETASSSLEKYRSVRRENLTAEALIILKHHLSYNYDLYNFIKQRFYETLHKIRRHKYIATQSLID